MDKKLDVKIQEAYDTEDNWRKSNPVLLNGQLAFSSDKYGRYKIGDGIKKWNELNYNELDWDDITNKPGEFQAAPHSHYLYDLNDIETADVHHATLASILGEADYNGISSGSEINPVYFEGGRPQPCNYTIEKSVPKDAVFTPFKGATFNNKGSIGYVPEPSVGDSESYLKGNGTWEKASDRFLLVENVVNPLTGSREPIAAGISAINGLSTELTNAVRDIHTIKNTITNYISKNDIVEIDLSTNQSFNYDTVPDARSLLRALHDIKYSVDSVKLDYNTFNYQYMGGTSSEPIEFTNKVFAHFVLSIYSESFCDVFTLPLLSTEYVIERCDKNGNQLAIIYQCYNAITVTICDERVSLDLYV